jgi:hypothetical protein
MPKKDKKIKKIYFARKGKDGNYPEGFTPGKSPSVASTI